jgi:hypothetical protein
MVTGTGRVVVPPVMVIRVEDSMDVMIARNTARRAASLLGFSSVSRAQIATAVAALADIILNVEARQTIHLHGLRNGVQMGIQVSCEAPWLAGASPDNALIALRSKLGEIMDEIDVETGQPPHINMVLWLSAGRITQQGIPTQTTQPTQPAESTETNGT